MAAATAAAAAAAGLVPAGPEAATVAAVAAEAASSFLKGTAFARQAAAVALGPEGFAAMLKKVRLANCVGCCAFILLTHNAWPAQLSVALFSGSSACACEGSR